MRICKVACCCHHAAFLSVCHQEGPWGCCAVPEEEEKDRVCYSLLFQKVCMPVYNLQKLSPQLPLLWVTARLFLMFTRPCQVSSPFMVSHNCFSSLCFFSALRNLLSVLKPSTHNLFLFFFNSAKYSPNSFSCAPFFTTRTFDHQGGCQGCYSWGSSLLAFC